jgi:beta-glucosidase
VQVYLRDLITSVTWADLELKAYKQVDVPAGETVRVAVELPAADCTLVTADGRRIVEPGEFELLVGHSSRPRDLLSAKFTIS